MIRLSPEDLDRWAQAAADALARKYPDPVSRAVAESGISSLGDRGENSSSALPGGKE